MTNLYKLIMDSRHNPLRNIPDMNTRHMIMQVLAYVFSHLSLHPMYSIISMPVI